MTRTPYTFPVNGRLFYWRSNELPYAKPRESWYRGPGHRGGWPTQEPQLDAVRFDEGGGESWTAAMDVVLGLNDRFYDVADDHFQARNNVDARDRSKFRKGSMNTTRVYPTRYEDEGENDG